MEIEKSRAHSRISIVTPELFGMSGLCRLIIAISMCSFTCFQACQAQEAVWQAFNSAGIKFFEDHNYEKAERSLLKAQSEAEKLSANGNELKTTLKALHKLYLAMDRNDSAEKIAQKLEHLEQSEQIKKSATGIKQEFDSAKSSNKVEDLDSNSTSKRSEIIALDKDERNTATSDNPVEVSSAKGITREKESIDSENKTEESHEEPSSTERPSVIASAHGIAGQPRISTGARDAEEILQLEGHIGWCKSLAISPDGTKALSGSDDDTVRLWDLSTGKESRRLDGHEDDVNCVAFSPDADKAVSASSDRTLRIWELETGNCLKVLTDHKNIVTCAAFSPGGNRLASGSYDSTIKLWDTLTGKNVQTLEGKLDTVRCLAFTPDGEQLISAGSDRLITLWRL